MGRREKYIPAQTGCSNFWCPTSLGNRYYFIFLHNNDQQNMPLLTSDSTKFPRKKLITGKERISSSRMDSSTQQVAKKQPFRVESTILSSATNQVGGVGVLDTRETLSPLPPLSNESPFHFLRELQSLTTIRFASIQGGEDGLHSLQGHAILPPVNKHYYTHPRDCLSLNPFQLGREAFREMM